MYTKVQMYKLTDFHRVKCRDILYYKYVYSSTMYELGEFYIVRYMDALCVTWTENAESAEYCRAVDSPVNVLMRMSRLNSFMAWGKKLLLFL